MTTTTCHGKTTGAMKTAPCPICLGKKVLPGICSCNMEWRGTKTDEGWDDCQCTPEQPCSECKGTGAVLVPA